MLITYSLQWPLAVLLALKKSYSELHYKEEAMC